MTFILLKARRALGRARSLVRRGRASLERLVFSKLVLTSRKVILACRVRHVHGPSKVSYSAEEVVVICVVRNGSGYIADFVEHYTRLGVRHIVFLDNGSTDETVDLASAHDNVTVLRTGLPYRKYENLMKDYLARRFSRGRWNLCADIDELFDYPGSETMGLGPLLRYLDSRGFTAVVAQMLDLFADGPLSRVGDDRAADLKSTYVLYDISCIRKATYRWGDLGGADILMHFGGIRKRVFGTDNGLTKAPLVFVGPGVRLFRDWHHAENVTVADFTCVLLHYPFTGSFHDKVEEAARTRRYGYVTSDEYDLYWKRIASEPDLVLRLETARRYDGTAALIEEGFLVASPRYLDWARSHPRTP